MAVAVDGETDLIKSKENDSISGRLENLLSFLDSAKKRSNESRSLKKIRGMDYIWEMYCDVETAVLLSKFVFKELPKLEKLRKLSFSNKDDPEKIPYDQLLRRYDLIESEIDVARSDFSSGKEVDGLEHARRARDQLKIMLLGIRKSRRSKK